MSDVDPDSPSRGGRVLTGLFWAGVGLVPLAGLLLLVGGNSSGAMRAAAFLAVLAVVLIGLSITLRPDASALRAEMEETLLEEIDMLREDMRDDITTAARATHQALDERVRVLQQAVDALRAELETVRAAGALGHVAVPPVGHAYPAAAPPPVVGAAAVPTAAAAPGAETFPAGQVDRRPGAAGRAHVPTGVVRHTETVHHVTTRSTFVDRHGEETAFHPPPEQASSPPAWVVSAQPSRPPAPPAEESWTDRMLRERYGTDPRLADRGSGSGERAGRGRRRRWDDDPDDGAATDRPGSGDWDRWASVRGDDRAAELRMGERRAAMRASQAGSEVRIEDRWAAMRREWDGPGPDDPRRDGDEAASKRWDWDAPATGRHGAGRSQVRALPPADDRPSWNADWEEPAREREPRGRRHRGDEDGYPGRRFEFELSDERWR